MYLDLYGVAYNTVDLSQNRRRIPTPDAISYTSVINAYCRTKLHSISAAKKAKDLLMEYMDQKVESDEDCNFLFTTAISAQALVAGNRGLAEEERFRAAKDAERLLEVMLVDSRATLPEIQSYNGRLNFSIFTVIVSEMKMSLIVVSLFLNLMFANIVSFYLSFSFLLNYSSLSQCVCQGWVTRSRHEVRKIVSIVTFRFYRWRKLRGS